MQTELRHRITVKPKVGSTDTESALQSAQNTAEKKIKKQKTRMVSEYITLVYRLTGTSKERQ